MKFSMKNIPQRGVVILFLTAILVDQCVSQAYNNFGYETLPTNIDCVQCNMRQLGVRNTCKEPLQRHNCTGCIKTMTKVRIKDSSTITGEYTVSEAISRYCMTPASRRAKPEGCYTQQNNGGYTTQCFCYTHNCNSHATKLQLGVPLILVMATVTARINDLFH